MMPDFIFQIVGKIKITYIKVFGSKLQKLLLSVTEKYYSYMTEGALHEEVIYRIVKEYYNDDKDASEECKYYVFKRKQSIDSIYDAKYGKSGRFMSHLFKLTQKIYLDKFLDNNKNSYDEELNKSMLILNKNFNKVVLYMFAKYNV